MQKDGRDQRVIQRRLRPGNLRADTRLAERLDDEPGLHDEFDPPAQRAVKPRNPERLGLFALLPWHGFKSKRVDPSVDGIEVAADLDGSRRTVRFPQHPAVRWNKAWM